MATTTTTTPAGAGKQKEELYVGIQKDIFAASPKMNQLQDLARVVQGGTVSSFTSTPFHNRVAQLYQAGCRSGGGCQS